MSKTLRMLAALLAMMLAATAGLAETNAQPTATVEAATEAPVPTIHVDRDPELLKVAGTTTMTGRFFTDMWGGSTADADVRLLIHGYDLIQWNSEDGAFEPDPTVVSEFAVADNEAGDRTYTLVLREGLAWSDGTPITAKDYAFSLLLRQSGEIAQLGGASRQAEYLQGFNDYVHKSQPLTDTELVRVDGEKAGETVLAERVLRVATVGEDGETVLTDYADVAEEGSTTLVIHDDGSLSLPGADDAEAVKITVDAEGIIRDWHYEKGVRVFRDGSHPRLAGVCVPAENTLLITVDHAWLPFFYELGLLSCNPCPIGVIAPGAKVADDGDGAYIANAEPASDDADAPVFGVELLNETLMNAETGYMTHPSLCCGPYIMKSFDGKTAEFELNPHYMGDSKGQKPEINHLVYTCDENETLAEKLATGEYDLLNKVTQVEAVQACMKLMRDGSFTRTAATLTEGKDVPEEGEPWRSEDGFSMRNYPRAGVSFIAFRCDRPNLKNQAARQAIAWCLDRDAVTQEYTGGSGLRADGFYGLGQWMVGFVTGTTVPPVKDPEDPDDPKQLEAYEAEMAEWEALNLDNLIEYTQDMDTARKLLASEGWQMNEAGDALEKDGEALALTLAYPQGNAIADSLEEHLVKPLAELGVALTLVPIPMEELSARYHRVIEGPVTLPDGETVEIDMFYLGGNFDLMFDAVPCFAIGEDGQAMNDCGIADEKLYQLAVDMNRTEYGDLLTYMKKWIAFEERFNEVLPMLPIYTNVYFDFSIEELRNYDIDQSLAWGQAILNGYIGEERVEEAEQASAGATDAAAPTATPEPEGQGAAAQEEIEIID